MAGGTVDRVEVAAVTEKDALLVGAVALFVFSLKYAPGSRSTGRYLQARHVLAAKMRCPRTKLAGASMVRS